MVTNGIVDLRRFWMITFKILLFIKLEKSKELWCFLLGQIQRTFQVKTHKRKILLLFASDGTSKSNSKSKVRIILSWDTLPLNILVPFAVKSVFLFWHQRKWDSFYSYLSSGNMKEMNLRWGEITKPRLLDKWPIISQVGPKCLQIPEAGKRIVVHCSLLMS